MLLSDGIEALKSNLFFSASSTLFVFLEKYLRMAFVMHIVRQEDSEGTNYMNRLEDIEEEIED
jgi:hypothetical protein